MEAIRLVLAYRFEHGIEIVGQRRADLAQGDYHGMSPGLAFSDGRRVVQAPRRAGFVVDRIARGHDLLVRPNNRGQPVTVPVDDGKVLRLVTLGSIIR